MKTKDPRKRRRFGMGETSLPGGGERPPNDIPGMRRILSIPVLPVSLISLVQPIIVPVLIIDTQVVLTNIEDDLIHIDTPKFKNTTEKKLKQIRKLIIRVMGTKLNSQITEIKNSWDLLRIDIKNVDKQIAFTNLLEKVIKDLEAKVGKNAS